MRWFAGRQSRGAALPDSVQARSGNAIGQALRHLRPLERKSTYVMRTVQKGLVLSSMFFRVPSTCVVRRDVETSLASLWFRSKNLRTQSINKGPEFTTG